MAQSLTTRMSTCCWRSLFAELRPQRQFQRSLITVQRGPIQKLEIPSDLPPQLLPQLPERYRPGRNRRDIVVHEAPRSEAETCKDPVGLVDKQQLSVLDPTGARARLFDKTNPDRAKVGDILLTTFKTGEPVSGVIMVIKGSGPHTSVLLRNQLTTVGMEMSIKVHSPLVQSMEIAQRSPKRKRRARLYYLRKPEHDVGSVQKVVDQYLRQRAMLTGGKPSRQGGGFRGGKKGKR
ncbi:hypothetical protein HRR83_005560 [Exophiala dermatitidis]|uniref:50S ribosomal protein L19 n=2 Tax=Exophiala dermatitidis TaxID=5970 RepID=H6BW84_EXODN|nr:uncharacterized protein HMPREF1120_03334 [Exophiala dermatitidis NIH/UT8656]KAJ4502465.1 hypothetical protein HRR75_008445 [Exophiala dermatitidis]EHY55184.1 hypothetical protein HMPREF1120_03334 [Exophiala dermatitidis NIH/UT8656]KAJ4503791.1 hypothetical protein HRR74_009182 [Exophiala dermatitidis]KAJ4508168.1 hypothetical protein HRR73_007607 [Exophiala dermatitidis]KAJ4531908.1 hypothetical protein HRR77_009039 [Exophiala dermatitidis]